MNEWNPANKARQSNRPVKPANQTGQPTFGLPILQHKTGLSEGLDHSIQFSPVLGSRAKVEAEDLVPLQDSAHKPTHVI